MPTTEFWKLLAGLAFFLYGMNHLEESLKQAEGRSFKLFLQKNTRNKFIAIISGLVITAILQSSSIVNLMVLSFVGAGMLTMRNAMAVVLGNNIGGTFNSWLVALLGFSVELNLLTLPLIGIAGVAMIAFKNKAFVAKAAKFLLGLGFLFLGFQYMKESMDSMFKHFDFTPYLSYSRFVFVLIGFVITALIQTSSATVALALSALYAKIIPIETAVVLVLGAELGTTIKVVLGAIGGIPAKKRVALGNFMFNMSTSIFGFVLLEPIIRTISGPLGIKDPIFILVAFQTFINIVGVIVFYFFLNRFGDFLENRFKEEKLTVTVFLPLTSPELSDTAVDMMEKEAGLFIDRAIRLNMDGFHIEHKGMPDTEFEQYETKQTKLTESLSHKEKYNLLKETEGEILSFYAKMLEHHHRKEDLSRMNKLIESVRNAMYSAKGMKDIYPDRQELSNSIVDVQYDLYNELKEQLTGFYKALIEAFNTSDQQECIRQLTNIMAQLKHSFDNRIDHFYTHAGRDTLQEKDISTLFNINRELYSSCKAIVQAVKDYKLNTSDTPDNDIPDIPAV
ncbi:MAG: Na/Pi cotransporter family protein [Sphingobacteriia bacterium]|nr:Na/Pi cotransporter family protein [Sphingobacteriia bacterium]